MSKIKKEPKKRDESKDYLSNKEFLRSLIERRKHVAEGKRAPRAIDEHIGACIYLICTRMGRRGNFNGYSYIFDMIGEALVTCVRAIDKFDPSKSSNPFGYFSRISWRAFCLQIERESDETYVKIKALENLRILDEHQEVGDGRGRSVGTIFTDEFVREFERKREAKRERRAARKG